MVSGVGLEAYWISSYLWDVVSLVPAVAFTMIVLAAAGVTSLIDGEAGVAIGLLFMLYALSMVRVSCVHVCVRACELAGVFGSLR